MKRYSLAPEDTLRCLNETIEIFCERSVVYFDVSDISEIRWLHRVSSGFPSGDALCLTAADSLFGQKQLVLIPLEHPDFPALLAQLRQHVPTLLEKAEEGEDAPPRCDQNGHHFD